MSSPMSCDSWMNYSSNSSDDLSAISDRMHCNQHQDSSEESSLELDSSSVAQSTPKAKRNFNLVSDYTLGINCDSNTVATTTNTITTTVSDSNFNATATSTVIEHNGITSQTKRLRGKSINTINPGSTHPSKAAALAPSSGSFKRKALLHRNGSLSGAICDIRMIDFAHTTFVRKNDQASTYTTSTATVQHQGPDNGFLRGIESLRRLLTEIANDEELECETDGVAAHHSTNTSVDGVS